MRLSTLAMIAAASLGCSGRSDVAISPAPAASSSSASSSASPPPANADYEKQNDALLIEDGPAPGHEGSYSIYVAHADSGDKKLLASEGGPVTPSWTPDGEIMFVSRRSGSSQIWRMEADGGNARQVGNLSATMMPSMPQLAKNGLVVFMAADAGPQPDGSNAGIWAMHDDGSGLRLLTTGTQPSLARSGEWISYTFETAEPYHREIWRINTDGTGKQQLTFLGDADYPDANASNISPDETTVAFFSGKESDRGAAGVTQDPSTWGHRNVAVVSANGGARRTITRCKPLQEASSGDCIAADNPAWTPDGKWLVHDTDKGGVWMTDLDGNGSQLFFAQSRGTVRVPLKAR
jgi:acylaminoacyl-peptidase